MSRKMKRYANKSKNGIFPTRALKFNMFILFTALAINTAACRTQSEFSLEYGVFLSLSSKDKKEFENYEKVVIDAQYYTAEEIAKLKKKGHKVYSYINIGSIEDFRPYYNRFSNIILSPYQNWEEEYWIDIREGSWKDFILHELAPELKGKGVDGLFVDNADIYYNYPEEDFFQALQETLERLRPEWDEIILNGGDVFLSEYIERGGSPDKIISALNQEGVFSCIDFENGSFKENDMRTKRYFLDYLEKIDSYGSDIYLLEYSEDKNIIDKISSYCNEHGYRYYISDSIELD